MGRASAFVLVCLAVSAVCAPAQTPSSADKPTGNSASTTKKTAQPSTTKTSTTASHKAHPASHPATASHAKSSAAATTHHASTKHASSKKKKKSPKGQQKIASDRAQEIQEALIREHYLPGDANGNWNQASEDAMRKYQADHGWQTKTVPDARALIDLGLGPNHDHLLNPESAMTTAPSQLHSASAKMPVGESVPSPPVTPSNPPPATDPKPQADPRQSQAGPQ